MGSDKQFREWVQKQPSALSGGFSEWVNGEGRNPACHVRRAGKSGIAYKAEFSCIPLLHAEHTYQHRHGEKACLERYLGGKWTVEDAKIWFDERAAEYYERWRNSC